MAVSPFHIFFSSKYKSFLHFRWTEVVGYLKKGFKHYSKTNPHLHNNGARINPNNSDEVARNLGVTINFCTFKVLI